MALNDIWEFRLCCYGMQQLGEMVIHGLETANAGAGASPQQVCDSFSGLVATHLKNWMSPTFSYRGIIGRRIFPLTSKTNPFTSVSGQGAGSAAAGDLPTQLSGLLSIRSALVGRRGQGRIYVPFPATVQLNATGAVVSAGGQTILNQLASDLGSPFTSGVSGNTTTITPAVYSRKYGAAGTDLQVLIHASFATQRRRGAFGRVNAQPF